MRRSDREITEMQDILAVMEKCDVCRLAMWDEEYPYMLPLNFGMEIIDEQVILYFHGANEGKKYDLLQKDPRVSFEMDCEHRLVTALDTGSCTMEYESVIGCGTVEIVPDEDKKRALDLMMKHYHEETFSYNISVIPRTTVFCLRVEKMTGKRRMKAKHM